MKFGKYLIIALIIAFAIPNSINAKNNDQDTITVAFWNLENLFDTVHDINKKDEEFTPTGSAEWTVERLNKKLFNEARVIRSMNNGRGPEILGFSEIEHQALMDSMTNKFLSDKNYKVAYKESPDHRGIDNGLIYKSDEFSLLSVIGDTIHVPDNYPTRLILNVNLLFKTNKDTLHVFVNHWPSRLGGEEKSEPNRIAAAATLKSQVDKLFAQNSNSRILIMGDFNDEPGNNSILKTLDAKPFACDSIVSENILSERKELLNLAYTDYSKNLGSYKYRDTWNMLDQIIISPEMIDGSNTRLVCGSFTIYKPEFMVTQSGKYKGTPFPTYGGRRYLGGYSDHFPVFAKFIIK